MTSSSSLYGSVNTQNTQSTNSTSLYGGAATPIPTPEGDLVVRGDLIVLSGNILTTAQTGNIFPANATTINLGLAATAVNIGAGTGTTTINNDLTVGGNVTADGGDFGNIQIAITDNNTIDTTSGDLKLNSATGNIGLIGADTLYTNQSNFLLLNSPTSVTAFDSATTLVMGDVTGTTNIRNNLLVGGGVTGDSGDFGNITIAVADNQTITTTTGELRVGSSNGSVKLTGIDALYTDTTGSFNLLNQPTTVNAFRNATVLEIGEDTGTTGINNNLRIDGTSINLAQDTSFLYSEAGDRLNRPTIQSTTGNSSGLRVTAPNTTSSALALLSVFNSSDNLNGEFIQLYSSGGATDPLRLRTGGYAAGVFGPTGQKISFYDGNTAYAYTNPAGPTDPLDLTTKTYVDSIVGAIPSYDTNVAPTTGGVDLQLRALDPPSIIVVGTTKFLGGTNITVSETAPNEITIDGTDLNTTYTVDASATTGGANFNLVGSDSTTDTIKFSGSGATTVTQTSANEITVSSVDTNTTYTQDASATTGGANLNLVGSDSTTDSVKFAGGTNVTVVATDANTITINAPDTNTTYTIDAASTTGGANFNLVGSDSTTDTIKLSGSGATTVAQTSANEITISSVDTNTTYTQDASSTTGGANVNLVGSDSTTDTIKYAGAGSVTVVATDANTVTITGTDTNTTYTQDVSSTTGGANLNLVGSDSTTDSVKFAGGTNVTVTATDANTMTITATDTNTTYDFAATATTGGANLNLTGSDSTTDTVKISSGTGVSVAQISGTEVSVAIGQAVGTGDSPSFAGVSAGNLTVGVATDNTIASTDTNGNIVLDPNGSGQIVLNSLITRAAGEVQASTNLNYTFPPQTLSTVTDNNGLSAASSFPASTNGYGANQSLSHYFGDTLAGTNTTAALQMRTANGNSVTGDTVPFTGLTSVAPSASVTNNTLGTLNFTGYGSTGFINEIATSNQGGGINALHNMQLQGYASENFSESSLALTSTTVTAVASSFRASITSPSVTGTKGQIAFTSTTPAVGQAVRVTGTLTGTATGIVSGQDYYIIVTNGTTTATLSATPGGSPIDTTAGTLTGLTLTRCSVTFTMTGLTSVPFGRGAKVAVAGVTNVTNGTYPVWGTPTTTSMAIGIPHSVPPSVAGSQTFSCLTTYGSGGLRVRAFPAATAMNLQNRLEMVDITPAAAVLRSNTVTFNTGAYGNTGVGVTGNNIIYNRVYGQWQYSTTVTPVAANTAYVFPLGTPDFNNIATVGSTSRVIPGAAGLYNLQFSVQVANADNGAEHFAYIWLRKNGADVANSMGRVSIVKSGNIISAWNYVLSSANTTDYWELAYAVDSTQVTFPTYAATAFGPATASIISTLTPVGA